MYGMRLWSLSEKECKIIIDVVYEKRGFGRIDYPRIILGERL